MSPLIHEVATAHTPESLAAVLTSEPGRVLLRSGVFDGPEARFSFVAARPFLTFRSRGSECHIATREARQTQFGNPWRLLDTLLGRYELLDQVDLPFPLGGCFGFWGYDLKNFIEPKLPRRAPNDLDLPDCHVGFYDSLVAFDHSLGKTWVISTGLGANGSRSETRARERLDYWQNRLYESPVLRQPPSSRQPSRAGLGSGGDLAQAAANLSKGSFIERVERAQAYIRAGDIYQVNLSQRLTWPERIPGWQVYQRLAEVSPAPFSAFLDCGDFEIASSSPEQFLRLSGNHVRTRPIKGTRPRSTDPERDAQLAWQLRTSPKELAELVMITDLLRNDLGKVCEFGSVVTPDLARLERFSHVQHLVSTVEGRLRPEFTHLASFASCFPGGSITGAPKFRAMEIIDELEPVARGPYTGALGYLGFNRESQLSIIIRTALCTASAVYFHAGAGIVADSVAADEYDETLAKAQGFFAAVSPSCGADGGSSGRVIRGPGPPKDAPGRIMHSPTKGSTKGSTKVATKGLASRQVPGCITHFPSRRP